MRDILAFTDSYRVWGRSMRYAGELALVLDGSLTGMFVCEPIMPPPSPLPMLPPDVYTVAAEVAKEAKAAEPEFNRFTGQIGVKHSRWLVGEGLFAGALAHAANWHDLMIIGSGEKSPWGSVGSLGQLLLTCDLPCIVVPDSWTKKAAFGTIAIAWNGSSEAVRAMHAAIPLLRRAQQVLLLVGAQKSPFSSVHLNPAFSAEDHLRQHEVKFTKKAFKAVDVDAGEKLLRVCKDSHVDLLVMGAYGRSRFSEWVLGGATRHVLEHGSLPVLMRH
jgi:nucleotide-binding universal stress UspA family protein